MSDSVTNRDCLGLYQSLSALHMMALSKLHTYDRHPLALPLLGRRPRLASNNNTVFLASSGTSEQAGSDETTASTRPRVHTSITALALSCLSRKTATTRFRYGLRTSRHEAGRHVKTGEDAGKHRHVPLVHPLPPPRLASSSLSITLFVLIHTPMLASSTSYPWFLLHGTQSFQCGVVHRGNGVFGPKAEPTAMSSPREGHRSSVRPPARFLYCISVEDARGPQPQVATAKEESGGQLGSGEGRQGSQLDVIFRWRRM